MPRGSIAVQTYTIKGIKCTKIHNKKHKTSKYHIKVKIKTHKSAPTV